MFIGVLDLWNTIGTLAFAACGVMAAWEVSGCKDKPGNRVRFAIGGFVGAMLTGWGGGAFGRDMLIRGRRLFQVDAINPENLPLFIATAVFALSLITLMLTFHKYCTHRVVRKVSAAIKFIRLHGDSLGCVAFGIFGFAKCRGIMVDCQPLPAVIGSFVTICGGGILAALTRSFIKDGRFTEKITYFPKALKGNIRYYILGLTVALMCCVCLTLGMDDGVTTLLITPAALFMGAWADKK